jgi:hypothetical protein
MAKKWPRSRISGIDLVTSDDATPEQRCALAGLGKPAEAARVIAPQWRCSKRCDGSPPRR